MKKGANYGWPIVSYGLQYDGGPIGTGIAKRVLGRVRAVAVDPAGFVYLGSDSGEIWRMRPQ